MSNPGDMITHAPVGPIYGEAYGADQIVGHLEHRRKKLEADIAEIGKQVTALADKQAELTKINLAIAALNGHPDPADVPAEQFGCTTCERTFGTQRGLSRHARVHKPPTALDVLDP